MKANLTIQVLSALGIIAMHLTKAADTNDVIKNQIPWGLIIMVCGMAMLMGEAGNLGVTETISALLESGSLPASAIIPFIAAVCGFLSLFVSGGVITPLIIALAPALVSYGVPRSNYSCITDGYDCNQYFSIFYGRQQSALPAVLKSIQAKSETSS